MRHRKPRVLHPEGRAYTVEVYETPKGIYVQRQYASHGCLLRWSVLAGALRRARRRGHVR